MELKQINNSKVEITTKVLIVPYGIETPLLGVKSIQSCMC